MASIWDDLQRKARGAATLVKAASAAGDAAFEAERKKYAEAAWRLEHPGQEPPKGPALQAPRESPIRRWIRKGATAAADALATPGSLSNQQYAEGFETLGEILSPSDPETGLPNVDFGGKAVVPLAVKLGRRKAIQKAAETLAPRSIVERLASTPKGKEHVKFLRETGFEDLAFPKYETPGKAAGIDRKVSSRDSYFHATRFSLLDQILASGQIGEPGRLGRRGAKRSASAPMHTISGGVPAMDEIANQIQTEFPRSYIEKSKTLGGSYLNIHTKDISSVSKRFKDLGYKAKWEPYPGDKNYKLVRYLQKSEIVPTTSGVSLGRVNKIKSTIPRDVIFELDRRAMQTAGVPTRPYVESGYEKMKKPYDPGYSEYDTIYDINQNPKGFMNALKSKLVKKGHIGPEGTSDLNVVPSQLYLNKLKDFFEGDNALWMPHENAQEFKKMIQSNPGIGSSLGIETLGSAEDGYTLHLKVPGPKASNPVSATPSSGFEYEQRTFEQGIPLKGTVRRAFINLDELAKQGFSEEQLRNKIEPLFALTDDVRTYHTPGHGSTELHRILPSHLLTEGSRYALPRAKNFEDFKDILSGMMSTFKQARDPQTGRKVLKRGSPMGVPKAAGFTATTPNFDSPLLANFMTVQAEGDPPMWVKKKILSASGMNQGQFDKFVEDMTGAEWNIFYDEVSNNPKIKEYFPDVYKLANPGTAAPKNPAEFFLINDKEITDPTDGLTFGYDEYLTWKDKPDDFLVDLVDKMGYGPKDAEFIQQQLWKMYAPSGTLNKVKDSLSSQVDKLINSQFWLK